MTRKRGYSLERKKMVEGYGFVSIWVIGFLLFTLIPLLSSIKISLTKSKVSDLLNGEFVGLENFRAVIADPYFSTTFADTITRAIIDAPFISIFALISAVLLNADIVAKRFFRMIYFAPVIIGGLIIRVLSSNGGETLSLFDSIGGAVGVISDLIGYETFNRMGELLWRSSVEILIFLAGLQSIPRSLYEAAQMDGATPWENFWKITLPIMSPIVLLTIIYATIDSFVSPGNDIMNFIHDRSFLNLNFGYGAALSWMYFLFVFVIILIIYYAGRRLVKQ